MRRSSLFPSLSLVAFTLIASACSKSAPPEPDPPKGDTTATAPAGGGGGGSVAAAIKAKEIYTTRCTPCHGAEGRGDGVASAGLTPKPRNFHDPEWHKTVDDAYLEKIIKYGGAAVGKSPAMPSNPDLGDPAVVAELRTIVRTFNN